MRGRIADLINAEPDEIGFTINTSTGMNVIVDALEGFGEVISSDLEFPVSTLPWMNRKVKTNLVPSVEGEVLIEDIVGAMNDRSKIISLSHVQFSNGFRLDLDALGKMKRDHKLVVNASQSAGVFEIDVKRMKIDALCSTGHKWMLSGYGSGFVYLSRDLLGETHPRSIGWMSVDDPYAMRNDQLSLRNDVAARVELGCPHFAAILAIGTSAQIFGELGVKQIENRALELNKYLTNTLIECGFNVLSPLSDEGMRSAETLVGFENPAAVAAQLTYHNIAVTEKPQGIRVSTHFFNNYDDVEKVIAALVEIRR
jgi:selenocysteine lyase/cysteine desulfurase